MKNVLVLTDFSAGAIRAPECELPIAAKLGADVLLVNAYPITPYLPPVGSTILPQRGGIEKRRESTSRLNNEARRLVKDMQTSTFINRMTSAYPGIGSSVARKPM